MRCNSRFIASCLLLIGLAGCAGQGAAPRDDSAPPPASVPVPAPEAVAPPPPPPPEFSLRPFISVLPERVEERFGAPGLVRREAGAEVWQYVKGPCVLLFFIYEDPAEGRRVTHAEARSSPGPWGAAPPPDQACLDAFGATE